MPRYRAVIAIQYLDPIGAFVERARVIQPAPGLSTIRKLSRDTSFDSFALHFTS